MEKIGETILDKQGHVYVCGDVTMASDVSKTITKILQEYASLSDEEAKQFVSDLRVSKPLECFCTSLGVLPMPTNDVSLMRFEK